MAAQRTTDERAPIVGQLADCRAAVDLRLDDRRRLSATLHLPPDTADVDLLLAAYRRWGVGVSERLSGDGVFALWDEGRQRLMCWRDLAGSRPFYYVARPTRDVIFSSDLRSLTAHPLVPCRLDLSYARSLIEYGESFQDPTRTLCDGVRKLPAGHVLLADPAGMSVRPYWHGDRVSARRYRDDREYVEELRELLTLAVGDRLPQRPDETVAAHLSGGLDSSSIAVLAQRLRGTASTSVVGVSWAPPRSSLERQPMDERDLVEAAAALGDVAVRYTVPTAQDVIDAETRDLAVRPATTLQVELSASRRLASEGVRTVLSGWGGDELAVYNGRGYFASLAQRGRWPTLWRELSMRSQLHGSRRAAEVRGRVVLPLMPDWLAYRVKPGLRPAPLEWPDCLRPELRAALADAEPLPFSIPRERPGVHRAQLARLTWGHLQYRMESWASHGADLGITYRYPLLDRRIIEFALSVPDHLYFKNGWKRWLYRTAMEGLLPDEVRWNPHKHDSAMAAMLRRLRVDTETLFTQRVAERRDNPFVDVDRLLSTPPAPGTGSALFLAFTDAGAP